MSPRERMAAELARQAGVAPQHIDVSNLDAIELPPMLDLQRHDAPAEPSLPAVLDESEDSQPVVTSQLSRVVGKALDAIEDILDANTMMMDTDEARAMGIRLQAAQTALNVQAKVDDTMLRARQIDQLPKLLEMIKEAKKSSPLQLEAQALQAAE